MMWVSRSPVWKPDDFGFEKNYVWFNNLIFIYLLYPLGTFQQQDTLLASTITSYFLGKNKLGTKPLLLQKHKF